MRRIDLSFTSLESQLPRYQYADHQEDWTTDMWVRLMSIAASTGIALIGATGCSGGGITATTSCADYLRADSQTRDQAVKTIGLDVGARGAGNPMAVLNVDYECGQSPSAAVGKVIAQQNY